MLRFSSRLRPRRHTAILIAIPLCVGGLVSSVLAQGSIPDAGLPPDAGPPPEAGPGTDALAGDAGASDAGDGGVPEVSLADPLEVTDEPGADRHTGIRGRIAG